MRRARHRAVQRTGHGSCWSWPLVVHLFSLDSARIQVVYRGESNAATGRLAGARGTAAATSVTTRGRGANNGPLPVHGIQCLHQLVDCERRLTASFGRTAAAMRQWRGAWVPSYVPSRAATTSTLRCAVPSSTARSQALRCEGLACDRGVAKIIRSGRHAQNFPALALQPALALTINGRRRVSLNRACQRLSCGSFQSRRGG